VVAGQKYFTGSVCWSMQVLQWDDTAPVIHHRIVAHHVLAFLLSILCDQVCFAYTSVCCDVVFLKNYSLCSVQYILQL